MGGSIDSELVPTVALGPALNILINSDFEFGKETYVSNVKLKSQSLHPSRPFDQLFCKQAKLASLQNPCSSLHSFEVSNSWI